jgi:hypothetical protein
MKLSGTVLSLKHPLQFIFVDAEYVLILLQLMLFEGD